MDQDGIRSACNVQWHTYRVRRTTCRWRSGVPRAPSADPSHSSATASLCRQVCAAIASNRREPLHLLDLSENGIGLGALRQFDMCQLDSCPIQVGQQRTPPHVALSFQSCTCVIVWARPTRSTRRVGGSGCRYWLVRCGSRLGWSTAL
jgi:hypothetical protein